MTGRTTLEPRRALLGLVLHAPAPVAADALGMVTADDLADPALVLVAGLAAELARAGIAPDPVAVLARARRDGQVTAAETAAFGALLLDLYETAGVFPSPRFLAAAVLADALRRRVAEAGARLGQAADAESLSSLLALVDAETDAVWELARRLAAVEQGEPPAAEVRPEVPAEARREERPDTTRPDGRTA